MQKPLSPDDVDIADLPADATESGSEDNLFVASLAKGLKVLESFNGGRERLSLTDIAARARIGKSATQRAVATLHSLGYLHKEEGSRIYRLSSKVLGLTRNYSAGSYVLEAGLPEIKLCHEETGETVNITERDGTEIVCIARIPGRHAVTINISVGWRLPAYATGPGLAMLAFEPEAVSHRVLENSEIQSYTKQTVTSIPELQRWLKQIRADGYVIADQLLNEGEYSVAAPILGPQDQVLAALNISLPVSRWSLHDLRNKIVPLAIESASRIGKQIADE